MPSHLNDSIHVAFLDWKEKSLNPEKKKTEQKKTMHITKNDITIINTLIIKFITFLETILAREKRKMQNKKAHK